MSCFFPRIATTNNQTVRLPISFMFKASQCGPNGWGSWAALASRLAILTLASVSAPALGAGFAPDKAGDKPAETRKKVELRGVPHPATHSAEQCGQILQGLTPRSPQTLRVREVLKDNLRWQGDRHLFFPRKMAMQPEIDAAYASLGDDDIPVLVSLIDRGELKDGMRGIALGVLGKFGAKALPCIEAGLARGHAPGATDLSAIKINIETELRPPPGPP